jgi:hypothetical protein
MDVITVVGIEDKKIVVPVAGGRKELACLIAEYFAGCQHDGIISVVDSVGAGRWLRTGSGGLRCIGRRLRTGFDGLVRR